MARTIRIAAVAIIASACLGACSSTSPPEASSAGSTPAASTPHASVTDAAWTAEQCSEASMADWTEHCGEDDAEGSEMQQVPLGVAYELADRETGGLRESMTIRGVECEFAELDGAASNPDWQGSDDVPRTIAVQADPGMEFCRITATFKVTGKKPIIGWTDFANLVTADGTEYAEDDKSHEATSTINYSGPSKCSPTLCSSLNPGTPAFDVVKIYQVPAGTKPTGVQYPMETLVSEPEVIMALT